MQVLHLHWLTPTQSGQHGRFLFWAETTATDPPSRDRRKKSTQPHPFTTGPSELLHLLKAIGWAGKLPTETLTLWLPTNRFGPVPSPDLLHSWETDDDSPELRPWTAAGLDLGPAHASSLLTYLQQHDLPPGVRLGVDGRYWQTTFVFILELLARQLYRPTLVEVREKRALHFEARWQPLLDGEDEARRAAQLATAMPAICRADATDPNETIPPRAILDSFLNHLTDTAVRQWATKQELYLPTSSEPAAAWLRALFATNPTIQASAGQMQHFASSFRAWERALTVAGDKHYRVALRLEAPAQQAKKRTKQGEAAWQLHYLLQARDDASLIVPAAEVWKTKGSVLQSLDRHFEKPQERLLTGLGYAARFFPPLKRSLQQRSPSEMTLTTDEAYTFLRQCAPQLQRAGFGLLVPPWWNKPGTRLGVRLKLGSTSKLKGQTAVSTGHMAMDNLVRYRWQLSLGETELSREEFDALVALKSPLVQIRGQWVQLDPEQIEAAIRFWQEQDLEGDLSLFEAMKLGLAGEEQQRNGLQVDGVELDDWLQNWLNRLQGDEKLEMLPMPNGLRAELRPYQQYGYSWLHFARRWGMGVILADDMGLGKCVAADTNIVVNGLPQTAATLWQRFAQNEEFDGEGYWAEPAELLTVNAIDEQTGSITAAAVHKLYRQHIQEPVRQIMLEDGNQITITRQHKLLTNTGWRNDLTVGDYVCVPSKLNGAENAVDNDLALFLAWQIAEGHERPDVAVVNISQKDTKRLQELHQLIQQIGSRYELKINQPGIQLHEGKTPVLRINSVAYRQFLEEKGYVWGKLSADKTIPSFIMQANTEVIRIFLRHFFEAEGSASLRMRSVEISTASEQLISQLAFLLRRFGIWLRTSSKQKCATNGSGIYRTYYFGVLGGNGARIFQQEIGFISERKQAKLDTICKAVSNTNIEGIPASHLVSNLAAKTGLPLRHLGMYNTVYVDGSQQFSEHSLGKVIQKLDRVINGESEQAYRQKPRSKWTDKTLSTYAQLNYDFLQATRHNLRHLIDQEVFYCRIKSIEDVFYDGWVYDLEIAHHHNFVANNIICHNTIQTLTMIQQMKEEMAGLPAPVLLICPTSVVTNWELEKQKFTPGLQTLVHQGGDRLRDEAFIEAAQGVDMVLTSYALARRDGETLQQIDWFGVALDEAQNIKNPNTKQAQTIRKLPANFRLALTGTPVENRLSELWSIMQFLNPGFLGGQKQFRQEFTLPIEKYGDEDAAQRLRKMTRPFLLRRVKTDPTVIQDLPDKQEMKVYCHLSEEQATLYEAVVQDALASIEEQEEGGIARKGLVLSMLMQLKQVCNHPAQYLHETEAYQPGEDNGRSGKLRRLDALLDEILAEGDRLLIFSQFTEMAGLLQGYIQERFGVPTLYLHGGVPAKKRAVMVEQFQREDGPPVFLLSLKAGGTGLNLTRANHVFHFDRWWNPAVEDQATDRAFRIGQTKNVLVHKFVCLGTLEERIDAMIEDKKALAQSIIGGGENWLTEMSTADLRSLVSLRRD